MAFVSSFTPSLQSASSVSFALPAVSGRSARQPSAAPVIMMAEIKEEVKPEDSTFRYLEEARIAKEQSLYTPSRGWTDAAETLNGRMAMMGFIIGLATELITGQGINAQLAAVFAPLARLIS